MVALALSCAADASAQTPPQERINAALARARQVGIPVSLLESKIAEGKAKGRPQAVIAAAIERRLGALERASQALRGEADAAASLAVGADAIESGVSETVLRAVSENVSRDRRNVAIATLTELVHQGHTPESALGRVRNALKGGPDALTNLAGEAAAGARGNGPPDRQKSSSDGGGGRGRTDSGPPSAVPAPGKSPQSERPGGNDNGRGGGRPSDPGQPGNPGRPTNPGRGGQ
jgi:hypothetical protein